MRKIYVGFLARYSYKCAKSSVGATFSVTPTVDFTLQGTMMRAFTRDFVDARYFNGDL